MKERRFSVSSIISMRGIRRPVVLMTLPGNSWILRKYCLVCSRPVQRDSCSIHALLSESDWQHKFSCMNEVAAATRGGADAATGKVAIAVISAFDLSVARSTGQYQDFIRVEQAHGRPNGRGRTPLPRGDFPWQASDNFIEYEGLLRAAFQA